MSTLYIVATPIGNLHDMTYRAVETLKAAGIIACEDTRTTRKLLDAYSITGKRLISCSAINEENSKNGISKLLDEGNDVALVTDAGTPCISDPGARVVDKIQKTKHKIVPIPGANAAVCAMSIAGNAGKSWLFEGFLPKSDGKMKRRLSELLKLETAFVLYESPFRIVRLLQAIGEIEPQRRIMIARELTKIHEETIIGTAGKIAEELSKRQAIKGEFCVVAYCKSDNKSDIDRTGANTEKE
ncbi:MAG TPA: 16S rRNA (cytidine(1402)-2'-O)-methyltransferase [Spirochaetaceae bacterium]|nr:16S rRNA (cytidine(1402)-2'-O)-methyltransferase [Spirochaetaceae bacterium]